MKKIPSKDKQFLSPEAEKGHSLVTWDGKVYLCTESASRFLFAKWESVSRWTQPFTYARIRYNTWKAFK